MVNANRFQIVPLSYQIYWSFNTKNLGTVQFKTDEAIFYYLLFDMYSGGFRGQGGMAPGPVLLVAEKGPARIISFNLNHRKTFGCTPCFFLMLAGR